MFNLLKKKETEPTVLAPCDGRIIPLEQVQDATFSQKMMGDGFAVIHFDLEALQAKGYDMTIPCVITNGTEFSITRLITAENAKAGKTSVLTYSQNRG